MRTRRELLTSAAAMAALLAPARLRAQQPPRNGILFIGSSFLARWTKLTDQMAPLPVFNQAFDGAITQDMLDREDELLLRYKPRIIVFNCGSNDVNYGQPAGAILGRTKQFLKVANEKLPRTFVYYTSILKAPDKRARWTVVDAVNREMERYSHEALNLGYIDLNPVLFDGAGNLREELFLPDKLHPVPTAYAEFAQVVKPVLEAAWAKGAGVP
jgi:lysophospholipase L1-like esterase